MKARKLLAEREMNNGSSYEIVKIKEKKGKLKQQDKQMFKLYSIFQQFKKKNKQLKEKRNLGKKPNVKMRK